MKAPIVAIEANGEVFSRCSIEQFLADNETLDESERAAIQSLQVGESFPLGGGAGQLFFVRRAA